MLTEGRHFDREIIIPCVRWCLRFKLSFRDLVEMMAERGLAMAHTTIMRWVRRYALEFERRWNRFARPVGPSWGVDETYVKISGKWFICTGRLIAAGTRWIFASVRGATPARPRHSFARGLKVRDRLPGLSHWMVMRPHTAPCAR
jgi:transposase-like protein